jgi:amino acid transporter
MVSYADLGEHFALNNGKWLNDSWCKSEMYILRIMDFLLAYTIVFLCLDRCVKRRKCCYGQRRFVSGICILISIWFATCYALIPILFFTQQLNSLNYGSYECNYNETQINELTWLDLQQIQAPYRTIYLIDFMFGNALPVFLMIFLLILRFFIHRKRKTKKYIIDGNTNLNKLDINIYKQLELRVYDDENPNLIKMVCWIFRSYG